MLLIVKRKTAFQNAISLAQLNSLVYKRTKTGRVYRPTQRVAITLGIAMKCQMLIAYSLHVLTVLQRPLARYIPSAAPVSCDICSIKRSKLPY